MADPWWTFRIDYFKQMKATINIKLLLLFILYSQLCWADNVRPQPSKQKLSELQQEIKLLQKNLKKIDQTKNSELKQLKNTDLNINRLIQQIFFLDQKIFQLDEKYNQLNATIQINQGKLQQHRQVLSGQITASYHVGQQELFKLLLNQQKPAVFGRIMHYYQYFHQARIEQIEQINLVIITLDEQRSQLQLLQQEIELKHYLKNNEKLALEEQQKKRNVLIFNLSNQQQNTAEKIKQLEQDEGQLKKLLSLLQQRAKQKAQQEAKKKAILKSRKPFAKLKGRLKWPLRGKLKKLYGRWRSVNKVKWKGNIIHSSEGKNVYSISHGTVVYSDWLRGYGLLSIIDHGNGYMSLYGYSQALLKSVGDKVEKGEVIATAGRTSGRRKAGIYFEIRYNGKPTNPGRWCKKMPK